MINKLRLNSAVAGVLVATTLQVFAQEDQLNGPQAMDAPVATFLEDRVHQLSKTLESTIAVHHYSFTAVRGQNVLLATAKAPGYGKQWRMEYRIDGGEWQAKLFDWPQKIEGLSPGSTVEVKVMAVEGAAFDRADYKLVFGSYPYMRYDFHNQEGLLPIPYGLTPTFLATQGLTEAMLEVSFIDNTGHPLEGGVVEFTFSPNSDALSTSTSYVSDNRGTVMELIRFSGCEGGDYAGSFTHVSNGKNTWATRYQRGIYYALNVLPGTLADTPLIYNFGHICKRWLINWSRN